MIEWSGSVAVKGREPAGDERGRVPGVRFRYRSLWLCRVVPSARGRCAAKRAPIVERSRDCDVVSARVSVVVMFAVVPVASA